MRVATRPFVSLCLVTRGSRSVYTSVLFHLVCCQGTETFKKACQTVLAASKLAGAARNKKLTASLAERTVREEVSACGCRVHSPARARSSVRTECYRRYA